MARLNEDGRRCGIPSPWTMSGWMHLLGTSLEKPTDARVLMTDDDNRARLARILAAEEAKLGADLERARAGFDHRGNRGSAAEAALREFLGRHLPLNLRVGHGEVVDLTGRSRQTDVVVTTEAQPFWPLPGEPGMFLAEAVYVAGTCLAHFRFAR